VILAAFCVQCFRRLKEEELEYTNDDHFVHAIQISRQPAVTKKAGQLLMAAEQQTMLEVNA
jgi:hypothetical protein